MTSDTGRDILRAWTDQLYSEYDNILFHFRIRLAVPLIRVLPLSSVWGLWSPLDRTITISRKLIEAYPWDIVLEILKHEMAHQLVSERLGGRDTVGVHGPVFRQACTMLGVADWAAAATGELPTTIPSWRDKVMSDEEERLLKRAEKLLALAASSNEHEAALAMQRVRQLYAKYNLERLAKSGEATNVYCIINRKIRRIAADDSMIFSILNEHFFVRAIYTKLFDAQDLCEYKVVELLGGRENVLMAEYVYYFLRHKLDSLWTEYRRRPAAAVPSQKARKSYMLGVLKGFRDKLAQIPASGHTGAGTGETHTATEVQALVRLGDQQLDVYTSTRFPRLSARRFGSGGGDRASYAAGIADGGTITLHKGITHNTGNLGLRINGDSR